MTTISLRLNATEEELIRNYAKLHNMSISELLISAVIEKIEDEIDLLSLNTEMKAMTKTYTLDEGKQELGLS